MAKAIIGIAAVSYALYPHGDVSSENILRLSFLMAVGVLFLLDAAMKQESYEC